MVDSLYTEKENAQFRGPTTSDNYNSRIENLYKDLVYLSNKLGIAEEHLRLIFQRVIKDHFSITQALEDLELRVDTLEAAENRLTFKTTDQVDNTRFDATAYEVAPVDQLTPDSQHGLLTLPRVESSSSSKLFFLNTNGEAILPSSFESVVKGDAASADSAGALIDTSDLYNAFIPTAGVVWERNVVVDSPHANGAIMDVYVRFPIDLAVTADTNALVVHPFPMMGCDILDIAYTTDFDLILNENDQYTTLNSGTIYSGDPAAVGWVPPGGWSGDEILNSGPKAFHFPPKPITGMKIRLRQKNYFTESGKYIYSYGLSRLEARYDKFLDLGRTILRFDAPDAETISSVDSVAPEIYNISEAELSSIFSYRVIWETTYDSGVYTLTPVPFSQRVWIEVSLSKSLKKASPALSGLIVSYS